MKVKLEHFVVEKKTHFGPVERSTGQDKVYLFDDAAEQWKHCGYIAHAARVFTGLVNFPHELGPAVAAECTKQKGFAVRWGGAPEDKPPVIQESEDDEDEFAGEVEE